MRTTYFPMLQPINYLFMYYVIYSSGKVSLFFYSPSSSILFLNFMTHYLMKLCNSYLTNLEMKWNYFDGRVFAWIWFWRHFHYILLLFTTHYHSLPYIVQPKPYELVRDKKFNRVEFTWIWFEYTVIFHSLFPIMPILPGSIMF